MNITFDSNDNYHLVYSAKIENIIDTDSESGEILDSIYNYSINYISNSLNITLAESSEHYTGSYDNTHLTGKEIYNPHITIGNDGIHITYIIHERGGDTYVKDISQALVHMCKQGTTWALLIGISDYQRNDLNITDLPLCEEDLNDMYAFLVNSVTIPSDHIITLLNSNATKIKIQDAFNNLNNLMYPSDTLIFYFAGHGANCSSDIDPIDETNGGDELICPSNYDGYTDTALSDDELKSLFESLGIFRILCIFDNCYSGGMNDLSSSKCTVLAAAAENETSWDDSYLNNGVFTFHLLEGFNSSEADTDNDNWISAEEAFNFASQYTTDYAKLNIIDPETNSSANQHPQLFDIDTQNEIELVKIIKDTISPTITFVNPINNTKTNIANQTVTITFSEDIQAGSTFNNIKIVSSSGIEKIITKNFNGKILTITADYDYLDGIYTIFIPANAIQDEADNGLEKDFNSVFSVDITPPTVNNDLANGFYNTTKIVTLSAVDNLDSNPVIYYSLDNGVTWNKQTKTVTLTLNSGKTVVLFYAMDATGNKGLTQTASYTIDTNSPTASANIKTGIYNTNKVVTLLMSEQGTIHYTTNGATPTATSTPYTGSISVTSTTTLKFIAVDLAGNQSPVYTERYTIDKTAPKVTLTYPKRYATGVSRTKTIYLKFSESILKSIKWSKIVVKNKYGKAVSITKWISGNTLYIKTNSKRSSYSYYTVYIPASAIKDYAGNNLSAGYTFKFKTGKY